MPRVRPAQAPPPPRTARLLGRDRTLADIRQGLERGAIVTLVGPHGVGKSELALHVLATREGDEHVFVDLLHARDDDDVVAAIAAALDVRVCTDALAAVREALIARGEPVASRERFARAAEILAPLARGATDPWTLEVWARALARLGRGGEAREVEARLAETGYARR